MDILPRFGVSSELSKEDFEQRLSRVSQTDVEWMRSLLFAAAVEGGLADVGDELVGRRKVVGGVQKHIEDVWILLGSIKKCESTLLKNGKRSKEKWQQSQARSESRGSFPKGFIKGNCK